ncbi:MAG TPA: hypothetical protein VII07_04375 [Bradyrhizobium sp.]|jgi:hypothetical protein
MLDAKRFHRIGHSGFHLSSAAFVECSARRRHNFGIQNSPGAIIIVLAFRADTFRSHLSFIEGSPMIQRSTSYPIKMAALVVCHISLLAALVWIF